jgi:hypothetical protein
MPKIAGIVIAATLASLPCSGGYAGEPHPESLYISDEILNTVTEYNAITGVFQRVLINAAEGGMFGPTASSSIRWRRPSSWSPTRTLISRSMVTYGSSTRGEWKAGGAVKDELGGTAKLSKTTRGTLDTIIDSLQVESLEQPEVRKKAFSWLAERVNTFVNVLRPRMRSAAADYQSRAE